MQSQKQLISYVLFLPGILSYNRQTRVRHILRLFLRDVISRTCRIRNITRSRTLATVARRKIITVLSWRARLPRAKHVAGAFEGAHPSVFAPLAACSEFSSAAHADVFQHFFPNRNPIPGVLETRTARSQTRFNEERRARYYSQRYTHSPATITIATRILFHPARSLTGPVVGERSAFFGACNPGPANLRGKNFECSHSRSSRKQGRML